MNYILLGEIGGWTFWKVTDHGFSAPTPEILYAFTVDPTEYDRRQHPKIGELYNSLDRAIISAIGEKYTGPRAAGGSGVGTAADWFARMIGMDDLVEVNREAGQTAMTDVLADTQKYNGPIYQRAEELLWALDRRGLVLASRRSR